jgi:hypothetical protein
MFAAHKMIEIERLFRVRNFKSITKMMDSNSARKDAGTVTGIFQKREDAERAYNSLISRGYAPKDIILLMSDKTHRTHFKDRDDDTDLGNKAAEKAGIGSAIGGTAGAIIGAIAAIGTTIALPGLGLVIAGPIVAGLTGAGAGGIAGGLIGGLIGAGIPKEHAALYEDQIKKGGIVVGVVPKSEQDREAIGHDWRTYSGESMYGFDEREEVNTNQWSR